MGTTTEGRQPYTFADTRIYDRVDPIVLTQYARYLQAREMRRLVRAFIAWAAGTVMEAVMEWHRRSVLRHEVSELSDHLLQDIGIRRDQIPALADGRLVRGPSALAEAATHPSLRFLDARKPADENAPATPETPVAA